MIVSLIYENITYTGKIIRILFVDAPWHILKFMSTLGGSVQKNL